VRPGYLAETSEYVVPVWYKEDFVFFSILVLEACRSCDLATNPVSSRNDGASAANCEGIFPNDHHLVTFHERDCLLQFLTIKYSLDLKTPGAFF